LPLAPQPPCFFLKIRLHILWYNAPTTSYEDWQLLLADAGFTPCYQMPLRPTHQMFVSSPLYVSG
jgi:hypothetical protein